MGRFMMGTAGFGLVLGLVVFQATGLFEMRAPEASRSGLALEKLKQAQNAGLDPAASEKQAKAMAEIEAEFAAAERDERWLAHKLHLCHLFLAIFLGCSSMFFSFLALLAWNRAAHGVKLSDAVSFTCFLSSNVLDASLDGSLRTVRVQLGLLLWYVTEAERLTAELARRRFPDGEAVVVVADRTLLALGNNLAACGIKPVDPRSSLLTELGQAVRTAANAKAEFDLLTPAIESKRKEQERLEAAVQALLTQQEDLQRRKSEALAVESRASQRLADADRRILSAEETEKRLRSRSESLAALREELRSLMHDLENWDIATDGEATRIVELDARNGNRRFPRLSAVARTWQQASQNGNGS